MQRNVQLEDEWLTPEETCVLAKVAKQTLANWRAAKVGPPYAKLSEGQAGRVRYRRSDVVRWLDDRKEVA